MKGNELPQKKHPVGIEPTTPEDRNTLPCVWTHPPPSKQRRRGQRRAGKATSDGTWRDETPEVGGRFGVGEGRVEGFTRQAVRDLEARSARRRSSMGDQGRGSGTRVIFAGRPSRSLSPPHRGPGDAAFSGTGLGSAPSPQRRRTLGSSVRWLSPRSLPTWSGSPIGSSAGERGGEARPRRLTRVMHSVLHCCYNGHTTSALKITSCAASRPCRRRSRARWPCA